MGKAFYYGSAIAVGILGGLFVVYGVVLVSYLIAGAT